MSDNNQYIQIKKVFYEAFDNTSILSFGTEFAAMAAGQVTNIYRLHDGIHIGIRSNMDGVTEKEIADVFASAAREFILTVTNDAALGNYMYDNVRSLAKILFIDKENITIII